MRASSSALPHVHPDRPGPTINEHAQKILSRLRLSVRPSYGFLLPYFDGSSPLPPCVRHAPCCVPEFVCATLRLITTAWKYHIPAAAYSRPRGQMSSTRRRKSSLAADGLTLFNEIFSFVRVTSENVNHGWAESRHRKTTERTTPGQRYARNPPPPTMFFFSSVGRFPRAPFLCL